MNLINPLPIFSFLLLFNFASLNSESINPIELWKSQPNQTLPKLTLYPITNAKTFVIICPGGGYKGHAMKGEGPGIAKWLNNHGISAAVLAYRLPKGQHDIPLSDAQKALMTIRSVRSKFQLNFEKLGIIGFSAGGHLAASTLTLLPTEQRPDFGILIYPVISFGPFAHQGSKDNLLGQLKDSPKWIEHYSLEKQIDPNTPPTFLAHAKDDKVVVIKNSQMFYDAVKKYQPKSKFLSLDKGGHGLNGYKGPSWDAWQTGSLKWISSL